MARNRGRVLDLGAGHVPHLGHRKQVLNANAITALAALSITIPLAARVFDLSFAYTMTLTGVVSAHFVAIGWPLVPALLMGLATGVAIGLINAIVVVVMRIDSFIGTLATGSLIVSLITMATGDTPILSPRLSGAFSKIAQTTIAGLTLPVYYVIVVAFAMWFLLEHTATGRRLYATGFNPDAAKLAGVRVSRLRFMSLVTSGTLAGATGIVLASTLSSGSPTAGTPYLLPGFAAAFLGATQLKHGRFNAWGTVIAVVLLGTGTTGLATRERTAVGRRHVRRGRADRLAGRDRYPAARSWRRRGQGQAHVAEAARSQRLTLVGLSPAAA